MKQLKLLILKGIPGSGKSFWARKFIKNNSNNWVIVNRDSIRSMLGNYWVPSREKLVDIIEEFMICNSLIKNYNVIVDATNLNPATIQKIENIAERYSKLSNLRTVSVEVKEFNTPLWKCVIRDIKRALFGGNYVGYKTIKRFHDKYKSNMK